MFHCDVNTVGIFAKSRKNGKESSSECVVASCLKSLWQGNFLNLILLETPWRQLKTAINLISLLSVLLDSLTDSRANSVYFYTLNTPRLDI